MKVESPYSLLDATENLHRLDAGYWKGVVTKYCDGLDLLPGPGATSIREAPTAERIRHVLRFTQPLYSWIVLDLGRLTAIVIGNAGRHEGSLPGDHAAPDVAVGGEPDSEATARGRLSREQRLHLLLNRRARKSSIAVDEIEKALGYTIYGAINDTPEETRRERMWNAASSTRTCRCTSRSPSLYEKWRGVEEKATRGPGSASSNVYARRRIRRYGVE